VAAAVGYSTGPAFGAAFRSVFVITPGRSRRGAENTRAENQLR
jgi:AraC-like DNA-binding protein